MRNLRRYIIIRSQQAENLYGLFCRELLRSEGLAGFEVVDLDTESFPPFAPDDLVILTRCFLTAKEIGRLLDAVHAGASAVILQPQESLAQRLGFIREPRILLPGYVVPRGRGPGSPVVLQSHVPVPVYRLPDGGRWDVVADATAREQPDARHPAVVRFSLGAGAIALFFYDLPEAVARIRFGNPDLASYRTLPWAWPHLGDMYAQHVDPNLAHVPQADLHSQLLADVAIRIGRAPMARLWYYEISQHRTACVFQSDGDYSEPQEFDRLASAVETRGGRVTFYLMRDTKLTEAHVRRLRARGHTFAPHVDPLSLGEELYFAIPRALADETAAFRNRFGECSPTLQSHCAPWIGYMDLVPLHVANGYRLLFAPLSVPAELWTKYMCGSGRPMKFFDRDGSSYDCWHQPVPFYDDETLAERIAADAEAAFDELADRIRASLSVTHSPVPILSHPVSFCNYSAPLFERCLDLLQREGVPIYSADAWCAFHDRRAAVTVEQQWDGGGTTTVLVSGLAGRICVMIPHEPASGAVPAVRVDGRGAPADVHARLGRDWLFIDVEAGNEQQTVRIEVSGLEGHE